MMYESFGELLGRSWDHTKQVLFRPFDLAKWLTLGFSAWLAGIISSGGGSGGGNSVEWRQPVDSHHADGAAQFFADARHYLLERPLLLILGLLLLLTALALAVLLTWVSSRAKFIFLDGVVRNEASFFEPWKQFRQLGDSLFVFRLVFGVAQVLVMLGFVAVAFWWVLSEFTDIEGPGLPSWWWLAATGAAFVLVAVLGAVVHFVLEAFIVPIMYRRGLRVLEAWDVFLPLLSAHAGRFILCVMLLFLLAISLGVAIIVLSLMTCCIGLLLLSLPYVGTVLLLPVLVTYRTFTVLFLADLDPSLDLFPQSVESFDGPAPSQA